MGSVIIVDMHIRDSRALDFLIEKAKGKDSVAVNVSDVASAVSCSKKTAIAILKRLAGARKIEIERGGRGPGDSNVYRFIK